ncbi:hypothetical protein STEG23_030964, partial [Scotinomys teguina]
FSKMSRAAFPLAAHSRTSDRKLQHCLILLPTSKEKESVTVWQTLSLTKFSYLNYSLAK